MFKNRTEAGKILAAELTPYKKKDTVVLSVFPRSIPIGLEIAKALDTPLEIFLSKKIGHPNNNDFKIGTIGLKGEILERTQSPLPPGYVENKMKDIRKSLRNTHRKFHKKKKSISLKNRQIILCDDGIATGNTILETLQLLKNYKPKKIIVAVPVSSPYGFQKILKSPEVADIISIDIPEGFYSIGSAYENFDEIEDETAIELFEHLKN